MVYSIYTYIDIFDIYICVNIKKYNSSNGVETFYECLVESIFYLQMF